jgi:hypothetical protein
METTSFTDYLPELYSVPGMVLYSFIGYAFFIILGTLFMPKEYTIDDYREQIRKNRDTKPKKIPFTNN